MCMRCRRRALIQACRNTSWQAGLSVLYTFIYAAEEIYDETLYNIYFRFPRSKLVGENSEYVIKIAVHDGGDDIMNVVISVVPRGNPTGENVPISADGKTAVSEVPIYLDS